jgi:hypothetical protein
MMFQLHFKRRLALLGLTVLSLFLLVHGAAAFTHFSYPYGERVGVYDARSLGMGQTGVAFQNNAFALNLNPACLAGVKDLSVSSSVHLVKVDEDRAFPFHDSFDGFVDYNTYAMNSNLYSGYAFGVVKTFQQSPMPTVGLAVYPLYDWNYDYQEQVRDESDALIGRNVIENRKGIYAVSFGLAENVTPWLDLGAAFNYLNGDGEFEQRVFSDTVIVLDRQELDADGMSFNLGAMAQISPRVRIGLGYRSEAKVDGTVKFSGKNVAAPDSSRSVELTYPYSVVFGVEYRPRNDLTTRLNFDVEFTQWSKFSDADEETIEFDDVWQFAGGVEHQFIVGFPARFGFRYQPSYQDKDVTTTAVTFGTGFSHGGFQIDFGGEVGTRSWREYDLFPERYFGGVERTDQDKVKESLIRAMVSIGYRI